MQTARSKLLNVDVEAERADQWPGGFVCPQCLRAVVVRAGAVVPAYFAHRRGEGTTACANYHPSLRVPLSIKLRSAVSARVVAEDPPRLAIMGQAPVDARIVVRVPKVVEDANWSGNLLLDTGMGALSIGAKSARTATWIPVAPAERYAMRVVGDVDPEYAAAFLIADLGVSASGSLFRFGEAVGRMLGPHESLSWGDSYWLISHSDRFPTQDVPIGVGIDVGKLRNPWIAILISLPNAKLPLPERLSIERWIGRPIREESDTISFGAPLPNHFDHEGMPVFDEGQQLVRIIKHGDGHVEIVHSSGLPAEIVQEDKYSEVRIAKAGVWNVRLSDHRIGYWNFRPCPPPQIRGVTVTVGDKSAECPSIEAQQLLTDAFAAGVPVRLAAFSTVFKTLTTVNEKPWPEGDSNEWFFHSSGTPYIRICVRGVGTIEAGEFGETNHIEDYADLRPLAQWLRILGASIPNKSSASIVPPPGPLPEFIRTLEGLHWDARWAAHIRVLQHRLSTGSNSHDL